MMYRVSYLLALSLMLLSGQISAQSNLGWKPMDERDIPSESVRQIIPQKYQTWHLNPQSLKSLLAQAPHERMVNIQHSESIIALPDPKGQLQTFRVVEAPIMEAELSAQFPHIRTYSLKGISDPYASGKLDWNDFGLHANIRSPRGHYYIDPYHLATQSEYIVYYTEDFQKDASEILPEAGVLKENPAHEESKFDIPAAMETYAKTAAACVGDKLRTYRLAVACTGEYAQAATGSSSPTVSQVLSKVVTTVNRVNGVYETELSVRLVLISNNTSILFTNPSTDPFNGNNNAGTLISESQTVIGGTIGSGNYDIGHTFSTGGGGLANLGCVCTSGKARGITGSPSPVGDPYDIDYVAHEIGHQFGGNHTFNAGTGSCSGNRNASTSMEPGSGITIMAYAGLCGTNNLGGNSIPYFHAVSYNEIVNFTNVSTGNSCASPSNTGNNAPVVTTPISYTIPKQTAFELRGSATDADGDSLVYSWEEYDKGTAAGNWNSGAVPYFRSYAPDTVPYRMFPKLIVILGGNVAGGQRGEYYPQTAQTLNFVLTARDNKMGGGGVCSSASQVVVTNSGPFKVTDPNVAGVTWYQGAWPVVTWDVAGTDAAPISCDKVNILISTDAGVSFFPVVTNTENDGVASVPVPPVSSPVSTCRLRIECANNVFFDINDFNFSISNIVSNDALEKVDNPVLQISPNPAGASVQIAVEQTQYTEQIALYMTDLSGKVLKTELFSGQSHILNWDLKNYPEGVYLLQVVSEKGKTVKKFIKTAAQ